MNRRTLTDILKSIIGQAVGLAFNDIVDNIFSIIYEKDYRSIKQKTDLGSDGIIEGEKICLACYAPERYDRKRFEKKVGEDYAKYEENYKKLGYKWLFITNRELLGGMITHIHSIDSSSDIWGINELINLILNSSPSKRRVILSDVFSLDREIIEFDFIEEVINEFIAKFKEETGNYKPQYNPPADLYSKIKLNFTEDDIDTVILKFTNFYIDHAGVLQKSLKALGNEFVSHLKMMVLREFQMLNKDLDFRDRFYTLVDRFSSKYPADQEYKNYVELILLYFFEQCLIGNRLESKDV